MLSDGICSFCLSSFSCKDCVWWCFCTPDYFALGISEIKFGIDKALVCACPTEIGLRASEIQSECICRILGKRIWDASDRKVLKGLSFLHWICCNIKGNFVVGPWLYQCQTRQNSSFMIYDICVHGNENWSLKSVEFSIQYGKYITWF